jgi:hypothetical protein
MALPPGFAGPPFSGAVAGRPSMMRIKSQALREILAGSPPALRFRREVFERAAIFRPVQANH